VTAVPRRSNDFQKVIYFVQNHIAPDVAVRESVMLTDRVTGEEREVDVLMEGNFGGGKIAIAIEVRDQKRKQHVEWVDSVHGKYRDLPVDKVVLVSGSGFTTSALQKAATLGIEALTPHQEVSPNGPLAQLAVEMNAMSIHSVRLEGLAHLSDQEEPIQVHGGTALFDPNGVECGAVSGFAWHEIANPDRNDTSEAASQPGRWRLDMTFDDPMLTKTDTTTDTVQTFAPRVKFDADDSLHSVKSLRLQWEIEVTREPVELQHGGMRGTPFAYGNVEVAGAERLVIVTGEPSDEPRTEAE
jgi:hypothetical protein